jgi:hypothetical protein
VGSTRPVDGICRKFAMKHAAIGRFCTAKFSSPKFFAPCDQSVAAAARGMRVFKGAMRDPP